MTLTIPQQQVLMHTARMAIRVALGAPSLAMRGTDDPALHLLAGCFVTLHEQGTHQLRGCVGRLDANAPLIDAIRATAASALADPRFTASPITLADLPRLELDLSILSPLKPANSPLEFDLLNEGIYLTFGERSGVFLPQVARQTGWTKEQLLDRLCAEKMGLPADAWRNPQARLFTFTTLIVGPEAF
jgi:AmmeMemoRadiSam system protein A